MKKQGSICSFACFFKKRLNNPTIVFISLITNELQLILLQ